MLARLFSQCRTAPCNNNRVFHDLRSFMTCAVRWNTHYDTLGIRRTASKNKIKLTYYELCKNFHPDLSTDPDANVKFTKIQQAYSVLGNEQSRKAYDMRLVEEKAAEARRRLQEARERDEVRKKEREKSEVGKAHPTTPYAENIGRWQFVMQERRSKGDFTWEHPSRYRNSRPAAQAQSSSGAESTASATASTSNAGPKGTQDARSPSKDDNLEHAAFSPMDAHFELLQVIGLLLVFLWGTGILEYCERRLRRLAEWLKEEEAKVVEESEGKSVESKALK